MKGNSTRREEKCNGREMVQLWRRIIFVKGAVAAFCRLNGKTEDRKEERNERTGKEKPLSK